DPNPSVSSRLAPLMVMTQVANTHVAAPISKADTQPEWTHGNISVRSALRSSEMIATTISSASRPSRNKMVNAATKLDAEEVCFRAKTDSASENKLSKALI